jgi:glycosyltransferase involved in cell wall biosynthesis
MAKPLISVIIPNYNYGRYLSEAIDSVLNQSYAQVELIVVDDGSTDDSEGVLRSYGDRLKWFRQQNQGVSAARNRGVQESQGEMIAFLDADDIWLPAKLEKQAQRLLSDPGLGLIHCGVEVVDERGGTVLVVLDGKEGWVASEMFVTWMTVLAAGSSLLIPRHTFDAVGGFDVQLSTSADWDFSYRISARQRVGFVPEVLIKTRTHGSNMQSNVRVLEHDMLLAFSKAFSSPDPKLAKLRRRSYGHLHLVLAGSFFRAGNYLNSTRHMVKSVYFFPASLTRALGFPLRWWNRRAAGKFLNSPNSQIGL